MGAEVEDDVAVEEPAQGRVEGGEDGEHDDVGDAVGDHVEDGAEVGGLVEVPGGHPVEGVQGLGEAVEEDGEERVGEAGEDREEEEEKAGVADQVGDPEEDHGNCYRIGERRGL